MKEVILSTDIKEEEKVAVLTPMELKVIQEIAEGYSSKEIGERLSLSTKTIEVHRHHIMRKTGAKNFIEIIVILFRKGILS